MDTFGRRLQQLRKSKNLSQEDFADIMDVSRQSISKWENDNAYPEMNKLIFMSKYFDVSLDNLVLGNQMEEIPETENNSSDLNVLVKAIRSFFSNLNQKQKIVFALLFIVLIAICLIGLYVIGYFFGRFLFLITH